MKLFQKCLSLLLLLPTNTLCEVLYTTIRLTIDSCSPTGLPIGGGVESGAFACAKSSIPGVQTQILDRLRVYCFVGFFPLPRAANTRQQARAVSPGALLSSDAFSSTSMTPAYCLDKVCREPVEFFGISGGDNCFCANFPPTGEPAYSPGSPISCSGDHGETCGSPGYAIVYRRIDLFVKPSTATSRTKPQPMISIPPEMSPSLTLKTHLQTGQTILISSTLEPRSKSSSMSSRRPPSDKPFSRPTSRSGPSYGSDLSISASLIPSNVRALTSPDLSVIVSSKSSPSTVFSTVFQTPSTTSNSPYLSTRLLSGNLSTIVSPDASTKSVSMLSLSIPRPETLKSYTSLSPAFPVTAPIGVSTTGATSSTSLVLTAGLATSSGFSVSSPITSGYLGTSFAFISARINGSTIASSTYSSVGPTVSLSSFSSSPSGISSTSSSEAGHDSGSSTSKSPLGTTLSSSPSALATSSTTSISPVTRSTPSGSVVVNPSSSSPSFSESSPTKTLSSTIAISFSSMSSSFLSKTPETSISSAGMVLTSNSASYVSDTSVLSTTSYSSHSSLILTTVVLSIFSSEISAISSPSEFASLTTIATNNLPSESTSIATTLSSVGRSEPTTLDLSATFQPSSGISGYPSLNAVTTSTPTESTTLSTSASGDDNTSSITSSSAVLVSSTSFFATPSSGPIVVTSSASTTVGSTASLYPTDSVSNIVSDQGSSTLSSLETLPASTLISSTSLVPTASSSSSLAASTEGSLVSAVTSSALSSNGESTLSSSSVEFSFSSEYSTSAVPSATLASPAFTSTTSEPSGDFAASSDFTAPASALTSTYDSSSSSLDIQTSLYTSSNAQPESASAVSASSVDSALSSVSPSDLTAIAILTSSIPASPSSILPFSTVLSISDSEESTEGQTSTSTSLPSTSTSTSVSSTTSSSYSSSSAFTSTIISSTSSSAPSSSYSTFSPSSTVPSFYSYISDSPIARPPTCPTNNNTIYRDVFGYDYHTKCGLSYASQKGFSVHADTYVKCIEYCNLLVGCSAVSYVDPINNKDTNCVPYDAFSGYSVKAALPALYAGVSGNGTSDGAVQSDPDLCNDGYNSTTYIDYFGYAFRIGCDQGLRSPLASNALAPAVANTLLGCVEYCAIYSGCHSVSFTGFPPPAGGANCFPYTSIIKTFIYQPGIQVAYTSDQIS